MDTKEQLNADRFRSFAAVYDESRPRCPLYVTEVAERYLGKKPETVVDIGCGTGRSTLVWNGTAARAVGVEPSPDMIAVAKKNAQGMEGIEFIQRFANNTGLPDACADVVTSSQSFHWMEPQSTLREVNRILKPNGVFMTIDSDWPPVCNRDAELAYEKLFALVHEIETTNPQIKDTYQRFEKTHHLESIQKSGHFSYVREILFANRESCDAERLIALAMSQGGLQTILKKQPELVEAPLRDYETTVRELFKDTVFPVDFCYRLRIGVK